MNCAAGDLAVVVRRSRSGLPFDDALLGAIRRVTSLNSVGNWHYEGERLHMPVLGEVIALDDYALRPIRDNDGQDETLSWKAVPKPDPVHLIANDAERALRAASNHALRLVAGTAPTELGRPLSA